MSAPAPLERRRRDLETLAAERWDLLVVGGGITGAGILLDAASRGLRAALIEKDDIAAGTSSRSSRLIHGGLRYLEQLQVGLIREALDERARLLRLAPHLVRLEPFAFPVYGLPVVHRSFYQAGLTLYDILGASRDGGRHRRLSPSGMLELAPTLRRRGLRGGLRYHDGVEDDARYALAVTRTAIARGALALTRVRATGLHLEAGRAAGVRARDELARDELARGEFARDELVVRAERVIDATGVWAARSDAPFGGGRLRLAPSRGAHLVVRRERIPAAVGMTLRVPGRVVFLIPWPGFWVIGTTDAPDPAIADRPSASSLEVHQLLSVVNRTMEVDLREDDILGTYAGLRPLVGDAGRGSTVRVSREHRVAIDSNGLVRVSGGKYTTYRVMAADAVDAALGEEARRRPSDTAELPLIGAATAADLDLLAAGLAAQAGMSRAAADRLVARHGVQAAEVATIGEREGLLAPLGPRIPHLEAEVAWAAREELALSLDDVLARRTRLAPELPDRGASIAPRVAEIMGAELGWDAPRREREVAVYLEGAHREYDVPADAAEAVA